MESGLRIPVVLTADGRILDGRSRYRACQELGITVATRTATVTEEADPVAFVISLNGARRHLTPDQLVALYVANNADRIEADQQAARAAQRANLKHGEVREHHVTLSGKTSAKIARATGVSPSTVERVQRVQKIAPERMEDVAKGAASALKILEEVVGPSEQPKVADSYLTEAAHLCKRTMAAIKRLKDRRAVDPDVLDAAQEALQRVLAAIGDR